ncbi:hypothetical protein TeGR_g14274 [Tetraparma gracilis]|jgi:hypothetical protein|uniref:Transmembrane protein n=1 Tax=Tetraparma gracilis TaxID=2962635 RepID=A0ABQ6N606_9STRA|nr:hypothetical protein TeGR_g14274 [Tetraparma gracilis]
MASVATICVASFGGFIAGTALMRGKGGSSAKHVRNFRHLPSQWAVRCGSFATVFEGGKVMSGLGREALVAAYEAELDDSDDSFLHSSFLHSPTYKYVSVVSDGAFAGGLAGVLGSQLSYQTAFTEGGKVMQVATRTQLSPLFMVSVGALFGVVAGAVQAASVYLEDELEKERELERELEDAVPVLSEEEVKQRMGEVQLSVSRAMLEDADDAKEVEAEIRKLRRGDK